MSDITNTQEALAGASAYLSALVSDYSFTSPVRFFDNQTKLNAANLNTLSKGIEELQNVVLSKQDITTTLAGYLDTIVGYLYANEGSYRELIIGTTTSTVKEVLNDTDNDGYVDIRVKQAESALSANTAKIADGINPDNKIPLSQVEFSENWHKGMETLHTIWDDVMKWYVCNESVCLTSDYNFINGLQIGGDLRNASDEVILTSDGKAVSAGTADTAGTAGTADRISSTSTFILPTKNGGTGLSITDTSDSLSLAKGLGFLPANYRTTTFDEVEIPIWDVRQMTKFHAKAQVCDYFEVLTHPDDKPNDYTSALGIRHSGIQISRPLFMNTSVLIQNIKGEKILSMHTMKETSANGVCNRGLLVDYGCNFIVSKADDYSSTAFTINYKRAAINVPTTFGDHVILTSANSGPTLPTGTALANMPDGAAFFQIVSS